MNRTQYSNRGFAAAIGGALFLSLTAIFISYLTQRFSLPALILAFWREFFVAAALFLVFIFTKPARLRGVNDHIPFLIGYGFVLAFFNAAWTFSVTLNGAAVATVLAYSSAGFSALLGWLLLNEKLSMIKILVVGLSLAGCALVVNAFDPAFWGLNNTGVFVGTASGLLYAVYSIMGRSASQRGINTWTTLFYIFAFASVFMLGLNYLMGKIIPQLVPTPINLFWLKDAWAGWAVLIALAVGPTLMGFGLYNISLRYLPSSTANLVMMIEPVFTALIAFFLFGERLNSLQMLGSAIILVSVTLTRKK